MSTFEADLQMVYGVPAVLVGDDWTSVIMLGHQPPLRAIAVANRVHRVDLGMLNLGDDLSLRVDDVADLFRWKWARHATLADCDDDGEMRSALEHGEWWLMWSDEQTSGSFPVTVLST